MGEMHTDLTPYMFCYIQKKKECEFGTYKVEEQAVPEPNYNIISW